MKDLKYITEEEVRNICEFYNEPFISYMVNDNDRWKSLGLAISIETTTTINKSNYDSHIAIFYDGRVTLSRNTGGWGGLTREDISPLITIDYLRGLEYEFKYEIPKKLDRKIKLSKLNEKSL